MTPTEPMQGNEIIARFMGAECLEDGFYRMEPPPLWFENREVADYHIENMLYHIRWDWLMPVVEKINSLNIEKFGFPCFVIQPTQCFIVGSKQNESEFNSYVESHGSLINAAYNTALTFINWYNSTPNGTTNE